MIVCADHIVEGRTYYQHRGTYAFRFHVVSTRGAKRIRVHQSSTRGGFRSRVRLFTPDQWNALGCVSAPPAP